MIRVLTWNVNSIRKRIDHLCATLKEHNIDIAMLQEIKCTNEQFPESELIAMGYECCVLGQKSRNGVAIVSRLPIVSRESENVFEQEEMPSSAGSYSPEESRYIECVVDCGSLKIRVISVYVPNGQEVESDTFYYKLNFLEKLNSRFKKIMSTEDFLVVGGDYNVAPENVDVHDPKLLDGRLCFHVKERAKFREILNNTLLDAFRCYQGPDKQLYSWWNYREGAWQNNKGLRIDTILLSPQLADRIKDCQILESIRGLDSPSDHAPVMCDIKKSGMVYYIPEA